MHYTFDEDNGRREEWRFNAIGNCGEGGYSFWLMKNFGDNAFRHDSKSGEAAIDEMIDEFPEPVNVCQHYIAVSYWDASWGSPTSGEQSSARSPPVEGVYNTFTVWNLIV